MQEADKTDAVLVAVTRDGKTFLGTTQMVPDQLPAKVKDQISIKIKGDRIEISAPNPQKLLDQIRRDGGILAERHAHVQALGVLAQQRLVGTGKANLAQAELQRPH